MQEDDPPHIPIIHSKFPTTPDMNEQLLRPGAPSLSFAISNYPTVADPFHGRWELRFVPWANAAFEEVMAVTEETPPERGFMVTGTYKYANWTEAGINAVVTIWAGHYLSMLEAIRLQEIPPHET